MMRRQDRAKQFMPFDAMKGLQEALRDREERHSRVEKTEISEETKELNSIVFNKLEKGMTVVVSYYCAFHEVRKKGIVKNIIPEYRFLVLNDEKIFFDDIYRIRIIDF